jgi:Ras-related protein Rab-8A
MSAKRKGQFDYLVKLLLIGDSGVGKSCILLRYCDNNFTTNFITTIGIDFKIKTVKCNGKTLKLQVWDTAGQERFKTICTAYYRGAQGIFMVYSLGDKGSFSNVRNWMKQIAKNASESVCKVLLANKSDLPADKKECVAAEGRELAEREGIAFFETSAKTGVGVESAFMEMAAQVLKVLDAEAEQARAENPGAGNRSYGAGKIRLGGDDFSDAGQKRKVKCNCA